MNKLSFGNSRRSILVRFIIIFAIAIIPGCKKQSSVDPRINDILSKKKAILIQRNINEMQAIEEAQIKEFKEDIVILKKKNPFAYSSIALTERKSLKLDGVMWDNQNPAAVISDIIVTEGDVVDGKKVKKITPNSVILSDNGKEIILTY